jgi:hypothetical protein
MHVSSTWAHGTNCRNASKILTALSIQLVLLPNQSPTIGTLHTTVSMIFYLHLFALVLVIVTIAVQAHLHRHSATIQLVSHFSDSLWAQFLSETARNSRIALFNEYVHSHLLSPNELHQRDTIGSLSP